MIFYHGTKHNITEFSTDFVGNGNDQYGPGIYFTTDLEMAKMYGSNIYVVDIIKARIKKSTSRKPSYNFVRNIIKKSPDIDRILENWSENRNVAMLKSIESILESGDFGDVIQSIHAEFFVGDEKLFLKIMSSKLIDGIVYGNILTLFNADAIRSAKLLEK